jgi:signal peptide peptidase SppA
MLREPFQVLSVPRFARVDEYAGAWAIEPTAGAALWEKCRSTDLTVHVQASESPRLKSEYQTVKVAAGNQVQQIAVIDLNGPLMKAVGSMESGTSTVMARRDLRKAAADPEVAAILLRIDSPGGTVSGTADLGAEVARAASMKPTWAFVEDLGASAAYWIASQTSKIVANAKTALVGSIGTLLVVYDLSAAAEKEGIKAMVFGTGPLKGAGAPGAPVTEEQQDYFRTIVNSAQASFDAAIRKGRGMTEKKLAEVKTGGVFPASEAMGHGLIDSIQSMEKTLADLAREARAQARTSTAGASSPGPTRSAAVEETLNTNTGTVSNPAATATESPAANAVLDVRKQMSAEMDRIAGIQKVCVEHPTIAAKAISEGWSVEKAENAALRASLPRGVESLGPTISIRGSKPAMPQGVSVNNVIAAAISIGCGNPAVEKRYKAEELQAADDHFRGIGLQQVLLLAASQNGYHCGPGERITKGSLKTVLKAAFADPAGGRGADTGFSSVNAPGILGNVANKELLTGYMEEDQSWRKVAVTKSVRNFQLVTSYRMLDSMEYEQIGPTGEIKHGTVDQESYTRQARTFAKMFSLTRESIINDDLGAFADLRTRLGRGAAKKMNNVFWLKALDNANFFTAGRGNYISGGTTNLGLDGVGLGLGVKAFRQMKTSEADGSKRVGGQPDRLVVPPELEGNAEVLYRNQNLGAVKSSDANIYQNRYEPVIVPWLSDTEFPGFSLTAWYLMRNPSDRPWMVVSFLDGVEVPTVESADADFDVLGVQFRGYHDFGCDQAEYTCGVKSKGAA